MSKGADPNLPDNKGMTPLGIAEEYYYQPMIKLLKEWEI
ncbi:ankyrin repeat domain-containing protein [Acetivibrio cellulolyticus]